MSFSFWKKSPQNNVESLKALKMRLDTSTYQEDLLDALEKLFELCYTDVKGVSSTCFSSIIKTIENTENCDSQIKILQMISFNQYDIEEINNAECCEVILKADPAFLAFFVQTFMTEAIRNKMILSPNIHDAIKELLNASKYKEIQMLIKKDVFIHESLVFEGIIDDLMYRNVGKSEVALLLNYLLTYSEKNQYFFISSGHHVNVIKNLTRENICILITVLSKHRKHLHDIQLTLFIHTLLVKVLDFKNYECIYKLIHNNEDNFIKFVRDYLCLKELIIDVEKDIYAFMILEYILRCTSISCPPTQSYKINTLLFYLGCEYTDIPIDKYDSIDKIIYAIFTKSSDEHIVDCSTNTIFDDEPLSLFIMLLNTLHGNPLKCSNTQTLDKLVQLRCYLVNNKITVDSISESLIEIVHKLIDERMVYFPKTSIDLVNTPVIQTQAVDTVPNQRSTENKNIIEEVKNNIKGIFGKLKQNENSKKTYDL